ncbi:MAG: polysaccharide pyruvyl transferase CsaB [Synechococcales bacterium]|nr:polysaccharide pyruvyl transferase CsaB [Synechococcales bacterium]
MRAVLCGYYGMGNGGDEALLATLLQMLPEDVDPLVLSGNPAQTHEQYGVTAYPRKSAIALLKSLRQADAFIWGGGSLMQDVTSAFNPVYYGGLMGLAQAYGLRAIAWAQGIGPLQRTITRQITRRVLGQCAAVSVRDQASAQLLADWQIPFILAPDPVWALDSQPVAGLWDLPAPRVAVVLRPHPALTPQRLDCLTRALVLFQQATNACLLLIPFQPSRDLAIAEHIQPRLPGVSQILLLTDPRQLKGVFKGVEMAIAMRLHGLIMAAASECRCFALSYDPKVSQLMADLQLPGWELDALPDDPAYISQVWLEQFVNGDPLTSDQIQSRRDRAFMHRDLLHAALDSGTLPPTLRH